ncbi:MAG TPA: MarR family transcriptional regulator [Gemmatimonadaceae bacterium]|nr:MarR family transcriptional regulator [Gemmatimonadaceae bacterium]
MSASRGDTVAVERPHAALRTWLGLLACSNLVEREVRRRLREEFGTTLPRFDVLAQLDAAQRSDGAGAGLTMSELSRRLMVTNGNLTGLVERLVQEGVVSRASSASDRRSQIVRLTAAGKRALDAMVPAHERWIEELFGDLSSPDRAQLHALLGRLRTSIRQSLTEADPS